MVLTTHIIFGSVGAQLLTSNPVVGFFVGFASHFILDAIPHIDHHLKSRTINPKNVLDSDMKIGKEFFDDLIKLGLDFSLGFLIILIYFYTLGIPFGLVALLGGIGGVFPDFLQFVYFKFKKEPLLSIQKLHVWAHADTDLNHKPVIGIITQASMIIILLLIAF